MTRLSERIAADVLKASGSGLQNYTMNGARERIIEAASVADDLLDAMKLALEYWAHRQQRYKNRSPVWVQDARAAITKATGTAS